MQFSWTGVGLLIPSCLHCLPSQSDRPREEKSPISDLPRPLKLGEISCGRVLIKESLKYSYFSKH